MSAWLISQAWPYLLALLGIVGVYFSGRHSGRVKAHRDTLEHYANTRKRMDAVETENDDPALLREWLRERGKP